MLVIRPATRADAEAIAAIYAHHVLHGTATFDIEPPSIDDTIARIDRVTAAGWPYLVAEADGEIAGYAYATQFRDRAAYRFTCEDSIYVAAGKTGRGIGSALLRALIERSAECGFLTMVGVAGGAEPASVALHRRFGFREAGRLSRVGFKFGRCLDSVYLQRDLPAEAPWSDHSHG